jgi:RHS repeat-associated protein
VRSPYGGTRYDAGGQLTIYRYTGQRVESGTGLYDYGARWYDPYLNRWIRSDTIVPDPGNTSTGLSAGPQALNQYARGLNNPLRYSDSSGHCGPLAPVCVILAL